MHQKPLTGLTLRAIILSILFVILCSFWIKQAEVVILACQVTESVPPIPAIVVLIFLVLLNPILKKLGRIFALTRAEMLVIYCFVAIATVLSGCGIIRFFFSSLPSLAYYATPQNQFANFLKYIPKWLVPKEPETIRTFYEGADNAQVPWEQWLTPLLIWSLFFLVLWFTMLCVMTLIRKQWTEKEKLTFPLLYLPIEITAPGDRATAWGAFFKNPLMWTGFGIAFFYNLLNIFHAFNPSVACLGKYFDIGILFTEKPLDALRGTILWYRPEMVGFGYLVSLEVSFSIWAFYFLFKAEQVFARIIGYERAGFPWAQEQGIGAYIAIAIFLLWIARGQLKAAFTKAFRKDASIDDSQEPFSYRFAFIGTILGLAAISLWCKFAGMALWVAWLYLGLIATVSLVYTRIRAETGAPLIWLFPWDRHQKLFWLNTFGSKPFAMAGNFSTLTIWATLIFMARGYFPEIMAYQLESFKLGDDERINRRHWPLVIILALLVGLAAGYWLHLSAYYEYGAATLTGGYVIWGTEINVNEYQELVNYSKTHKPPDLTRTAASAIGFVIASGLMLLRMIFLKFPLHPLGYAMACAYGDLIWGSFFIVWLIKLVVFKLGGIKLYKRLIPAFLGLALGHFFTAGVLWGNFGVYFGEVFRRYAVWFG